MKKKNWLCLVLIALTLAVFFVYRTMERLRNDYKSPEITISSEMLEVSVQDSRDALLQGVTAKDNVDGDVTASLIVESVRLADTDGTVKVSYAAFDKAGNVAKAERQVHYIDYQSPRFSLSEPLTFAQGSNFDVLDVITAQDMLDGDITHRIRANAMSDTSLNTLGTHDIQIRVTNSLGDTVQLVIPVEVYASGAYDAQLELTDYLIYLNVGDRFDADDYLLSFNMGREAVSIRNGMPSGYSLRTVGAVDTNNPGVYTVTYKVTCHVGNTADTVYTGYSKLIVVVEG